MLAVLDVSPILAAAHHHTSANNPVARLATKVDWATQNKMKIKCKIKKTDKYDG